MSDPQRIAEIRRELGRLEETDTDEPDGAEFHDDASRQRRDRRRQDLQEELAELDDGD